MSDASDLISAPELVDASLPSDQRSSPEKPSGSAWAASISTSLPSKGVALVVMTSEARAEDAARALRLVLPPEATAILLPSWDCLPYDRASPSRTVMGRRMAALDALSSTGDTLKVLVVSADCLVQRLPPPQPLPRFEIREHDHLDRAALQAFCAATGYVEDDRIDEPGEVAFLGEVIDVFPADAIRPIRIDLDADDRVTSLRLFDPITQRSDGTLDGLVIGPASEIIGTCDRLEGYEHGLADHYPILATIADYVENPRIIAEPGAIDRSLMILDLIDDAYQAALTFSDTDRPTPPTRLYLAPSEIHAIKPLDIGNANLAACPPRFARAPNPAAALRDWVGGYRQKGYRVVVAALPHEHRVLASRLRRSLGERPEAVPDWATVLAAACGSLLAIDADFDGGFVDATAKIALLTPTDIAGARIARPGAGTADLVSEPELRPGDVVIHEDHGLGVLEALEQIEADGEARDVLRLRYHGEDVILAPVQEFGRIWRYGSQPDAVTLDRLNGGGWAKRRAALSLEIEAVAARLVDMARERERAKTEPVVPPAAAYRRFAARFAFPESTDQAAAIEAVLGDLASGRPMRRLVCGDVGFGKTEVALRAAAAAALSGLQVVVAVPTTVLARQHSEAFQKRFADTGLKVAHLSRLVETSEACAVRTGLQSGAIDIVIGTHALASDLKLSRPGLVVIDEEHRFGTDIKAALAGLAPHLLSLTATPIPRTLQSALVGIQDVSIIASPPSRRRPIRTFLSEFDGGAVRTALTREKRRGGQSFVVVPRIEDMAEMRAILQELVPELSVLEAHGKRPADEVDTVMMEFSGGRGDILLATNIIENGLDVPRANTMIIFRPDRFGLAQLHQLRGRVGRGRRQAVTYLLSASGETLSEATRARLSTLEAHDRLGSGFAISARDLDLRGGGDLTGDDQTGHVKLIGASLYQHVLKRAVLKARGETELDYGPPTMNLAFGAIPETYVPDPTVRINLYARLCRAEDVDAVDALAEEIADRFGPPTEPLQTLLSHTRLSALARRAGVVQLTVGPKATAFTLANVKLGAVSRRVREGRGRRWTDNRLICEADDLPHDEAFIEEMLARLAA